MINQFNPYILILFPISTLFITALLIINRFRGYVEEETVGEIRTVSPAPKIIKLIFLKIVGSVEVIVIIISLYLLTVMASSIAYYTYSMKSTHLEDRPHIFDVAGISSSTSVVDEVMKIRYSMVIIQIYKIVMLNVNDEQLSFYPLLIDCDKSIELVKNVSKEFEMLTSLCTALETNDTIILNKYLKISLSEVSINGISYKVSDADLRPLLDIELIPGLYILHSIGNIGGTVIKLDDINKLALFRLSSANINLVCGHECDAKIIVLYLKSALEEYDSNDVLNIYRNTFEYVIVRQNNTAIIYSRAFVPAPESIAGLLILLLISAITLLSISGSLVEKVTYIVDRLWSMGVSREIYGASAILALIMIFGFAAIPITIASYIGLLNSFSLSTYLIVSIISIFILSNQLTKSLKMVKKPSQEFNAVYISERYLDVEKLKNCVTRYLHSDDFFYLNEVEILENGQYFILRLEMMYRRALSTIVSSEIYVDSYDSLWKYIVDIDVWSIEEFSPRETRYIASLALSKIYGGLTSCLER